MRSRLGKDKESTLELIKNLHHHRTNTTIDFLTLNTQSISRFIPRSHIQMRRGYKSQKVVGNVLKSTISKNNIQYEVNIAIRKEIDKRQKRPKSMTHVGRKLKSENLGTATKGVIAAIQKWNEMDSIDEIIVFGLTDSMVLPYKDIPHIFIKVKAGADEDELFADMMEENYGNINMGPTEIIFNTDDYEYEDYNIIKRGVTVDESFFHNVISI